MALEAKKAGQSCKIVQEVVRSCPYPINEGMSREACLWVYHEQVKKEVEAKQKHEVVICDRSAIDSFVYAKVKNCLNLEDPYMLSCYEAAQSWMETYDQIFFVVPDEFKPVSDGVRSPDVTFQISVHKAFEFLVDNLNVEVTKIHSKDIFKNL